MSHRTQVILTDAQYARLREESARTGVGLAELVRRALGAVYGTRDVVQARESLQQSFGAWQGRPTDGEAYVDDLRPGMARRLGR